MVKTRIIRRNFLKGRRSRRLQYKKILSKLRTLVPNEIPVKSFVRQVEKKKFKGKGQRGKKKNKPRKWKPKPLIDNFGRPLYIPRKFWTARKLWIDTNFVKWVEDRQRKKLNYARLDIRFSGRWRRFNYDPNFKPKRFYSKKKKPTKRSKLISRDDWSAEKRTESYESYIRKYLEQKTSFRAKKRKRVLKKLRRESRMLKTFLGALIRRGKKSKAIKIFRSLLRIISLSKFYRKRGRKKSRLKKNPMRFIFRAIVLASPRIMLKSKRVGGIIYRLPIFIESSRRTRSLGMRWIVASAQKRPEKLMAERLANEIIDIHRNKGSTLKRKAEIYKIGVGNKAFVHYMWRKKKKRKKALKKINRR